MGAMTFGLWGSGDASDAGAMAVLPVPRQAPAPGGDREDAGAGAAGAADARDASPGRPARRSYETTVVAERPTTRRPASAPSPQATSGPPAAQPVPSPARGEPVRKPAAVSGSGQAQAATSVVGETVPPLPPSGGSLPRPVQDVPATVRRTAEAVLASVDRAADAAQGAVRDLPGPLIEPLTDAAPAPTLPKAADVVASALPGAAPAP
jgi:hypothetical protein